MTGFRFTESAYIAADSEQRANGVVESLRDAVRRIAERPSIGRPKDDLARGMRAHVTGSYVVFYRQEQDLVIVLRILHSARDIQREFASED